MNSTLGNFCQRHAQAIATLHNVTVLYITLDKKLTQNYVIEKRTTKGVQEIICYYKNRGFYGSGFLRAYGYVFKLELLNRIQDFNVIHVNVLFRAGFLALQLFKRHKIPYVITEHWTGYHANGGENISWLQGYISKKIASKAAKILPVSAHLGESMKTFGLNSEYKVVPNVVDTKTFTPEEYKPNKFRFIHVSSLADDHKNVSGIIRAFSKIKSQMNAKLEIIGDGNIQPFQSQAKELGLTADDFKIKGEQPIEEIAKSMAQANSFILFSNYENQPCVISEAYAAGIPVIATDVGGIKEHLTEKHGILIKKGDEEALQTAMLYMYKNINHFTPSWLRSYAVEHFSVNAIASQFSEIYNEIL